MQRQTPPSSEGAMIVNSGTAPSGALEQVPFTTTGLTRVSTWRAKAIAFLRIAFGLVWAVAAALKWQPKFTASFADQVTGAKDGQPPLVQNWISFWGNIINTNPHFFAYLIASIETALAVFFIFGILTNLTAVVSIIYSLGIWSIAEGFGGPIQPGKSTDIGTAFVYALLAGTLLAVAAGRYYGVDQWLSPRLGRLSILSAGPVSFRRRRTR